MAGQLLDAAQVKSLAELPPLPVVRARLLGMLQAPAGQLVRTIAEPARSLAAVFRAYSEKAPAASVGEIGTVRVPNGNAMRMRSTRSNQEWLQILRKSLKN